jgi:hypothetical protein
VSVEEVTVFDVRGQVPMVLIGLPNTGQGVAVTAPFGPHVVAGPDSGGPLESLTSITKVIMFPGTMPDTMKFSQVNSELLLMAQEPFAEDGVTGPLAL